MGVMKKELSNTEINGAVAKELNWFKPDSFKMGLNVPDFCNDLNACEKWILPKCHDEVIIMISQEMKSTKVIIETDNKKWYSDFNDKVECENESTAKAWCLAFLKAKGVNVDG